MKLNLREKIWCFLFKIKFLRKYVFYKLARYKKKLKTLDNLKLNSKANIIDIGGNNGVVSYYLYDKYRCNIDIYEPNPYCLLILKNIFLDIKKIKINASAVSNVNSVKKLYYHQFETNFKNMSLLT